MQVGVPKETSPIERRVALVPESVPKLIAAKLAVSIQHEAGVQAFAPDDLYQKAGASIVPDAGSALGSDIVLKVQPPSLDETARIREGALLISFLQPSTNAPIIAALARRKVTAFALELVPRISRAQSMDALSSQAGVAGYKGVLMAASRVGKFFPMLMTAAGTIPPARVLVVGAGVAGLQAIATARRLGAVVEAYDVRPAARDEVRSLGASFIELPLETQEGTGGYAREQSEDFLRRQRELLAERVAAADVLITTAAVPGRKAPVIISGEMVHRMRPGSVIVDLAADSGGNCELTKAGEVVVVDGVTIDGTRNVAATLPQHASRLYSSNVTNLLLQMVKDGQLNVNLQDEVIKGTLVTHDGEVVNPQAKQALEAKTA
jgi:NAD(P) transhydrogenase subunit alpha